MWRGVCFTKKKKILVLEHLESGYLEMFPLFSDSVPHIKKKKTHTCKLKIIRNIMYSFLLLYNKSPEI